MLLTLKHKENESFEQYHNRLHTIIKFVIIVPCILIFVVITYSVISDFNMLQNKILIINKRNRFLEVQIAADKRILEQETKLLKQNQELKDFIIEMSDCQKNRIIDLNILARSYSLCGELCRNDASLEELRLQKNNLVKK